MSSPIKLVVGLGNPGKEYERTRHNAGFWLVDALAQSMGARFARENKFHGDAAKAAGVWLLKPLTYMNRSGQAVGALAKFYQIAPEEVLVVHDEMDLPAGRVKMKIGGAAGSNGVKDIVGHLGTREFWRLRIGVGHPRDLAEKLGGGVDRPEVVDYVLHRPDAADERAIRAAIDECVSLWPKMAAGDMEAAMLRLHSKKSERTDEGV